MFEFVVERLERQDIGHPNPDGLEPFVPPRHEAQAPQPAGSGCMKLGLVRNCLAENLPQQRTGGTHKRPLKLRFGLAPGFTEQEKLRLA